MAANGPKLIYGRTQEVKSIIPLRGQVEMEPKAKNLMAGLKSQKFKVFEGKAEYRYILTQAMKFMIQL